jgi:putative hydrolase of the HAD superfamily
VRRVPAILFDFGDTIAIEATERRDSRGVTVAAQLFPGAATVIRQLADEGYRLALVADTVPGTGREPYDNVLQQHDLAGCFTAVVTSDDASGNKPAPAIFRRALEALKIPERDWADVVMVGNRLERDVRGANQLGLISVWARMTDRYPSEPAAPEEEPCYVISALPELLALVKRLEGATGGRPLPP